MKSVYKVLLLINFSLSIVLVLIYFSYCFYFNKTNHTGINFFGVSSFFVVVNLLMYKVYLSVKSKKYKIIYYLSLFSSITFMVIVVLFGYCNVMMTYEEWQEKNMVPKYGIYCSGTDRKSR
jgi:hypothetical protein